MRRLIPTAALILISLPPPVQAADPAGPPVRYVSAFEQPSPAQPPAKLPVAPTPKAPAPKAVEPKQPSPIERAFASPFARGTEAGGAAARSYNENFDGDNVGVFYRMFLVTGFDPVTRTVGFTQQVVGTTQRQVGTTPRVIGNTQTIVVTTDSSGQTTQVVTTTPVTVQDPVFVLDPVIATTPVTATQLAARRTAVLLPAARYSGVQVTENDSPRPTDRLYFGYQFYSDAGAALNPGVGGSDIQRQTAGFETTFLDGGASVGLRLPYVQQYGPAGLAAQTVGDLSVLFKFAVFNDPATGDLASVGLMITTPTGGDGNFVLADGSPVPHSTLFQPWAGFVRMSDAGYVQGISNLIVPTDARDPTVFGTSLGAGYFLYRNPDGLLTGITPRAEVHLRTPLDRRDPNGLVYFPDQVNVNGGVTLRFDRAALNTSVSVPVVGPRPWAVEAITHLNVAF